MILQHVASGTTAVVITPTASNPKAFRHRNLDAFHIVAIPERLKDGIGKALHQEILNRFLSEVVVDPIDLSLVKLLSDDLIQFPCRIQVTTKRLFDDNLGGEGGTFMTVGQTARTEVFQN